MRIHNVIAKNLRIKNSHWSSDQLFQVRALQLIVVHDGNHLICCHSAKLRQYSMEFYLQAFMNFAQRQSFFSRCHSISCLCMPVGRISLALKACQLFFVGHAVQTQLEKDYE